MNAVLTASELQDVNARGVVGQTDIDFEPCHCGYRGNQVVRVRDTTTYRCGNIIGNPIHRTCYACPQCGSKLTPLSTKGENNAG